MSKRLTFLVNSCRECPFAVPPDYNPDAPWYCSTFGGEIDDLEDLPEWCPLENWEDSADSTSFRKFHHVDC
jgi:hypothetical protein